MVSRPPSPDTDQLALVVVRALEFVCGLHERLAQGGANFLKGLCGMGALEGFKPGLFHERVSTPGIIEDGKEHGAGGLGKTVKLLLGDIEQRQQ